MTGASTLCTLLSSTRISRAFSQRIFTSFSGRGSHFLSCSIHRSSIAYNQRSLPARDCELLIVTVVLFGERPLTKAILQQYIIATVSLLYALED